MAMTTCKECGNELSTKAEACPKCGAKRPRTSGCLQIILVLIGLIILLPILSECGGNSPSSSSSPSVPARESSQPAAQATTTAPSPPAPPAPGAQWHYRQQNDPMATGTSYFAVVQSTNTVEFDFPYSGRQHGTLTIRTHPRHGKDVIFSIERGQLLCRSYEDCTVLVRFDDQEAQRYSGIGAADNSSETIFIHNYSRFVGAMMKADTVRISAEVYQEGSPVFEFDVRGFDVEKYRPSN